MEGKEITFSKGVASISIFQNTRRIHVDGKFIAEMALVQSNIYDAELVCEALNVANQTGMTPSTLHSKLEKARELLKKSRSYFNTKDCFGDIISDIDNYFNQKK